MPGRDLKNIKKKYLDKMTFGTLRSNARHKLLVKTNISLPVGVVTCFSVNGRWPKPCSTT